MKNHLVYPSLIYALLLSVSAATAQISQHPITSQAFLVDTISVQVPLTESSTGEETAAVTTVWLMSDSTYELILDVESLEFSGSGVLVDALSLAGIIERAITASAENALVTQPINPIRQGSQIRVYVHGWAERFGVGISTTFMACNAGIWCRYQCLIAWPDPKVVIGTVEIDSCSTCAPTCEPTGRIGSYLE